MTESSVFSRADAPATAPVLAGTVAVLRAGDAGPEVLLLERSRSTRFMAGAYVFPGGRLDDADADPSFLSSEDRAWCAARIASTRLSDAADGDASWTMDPDVAGALFVATARELFEEVGLLLARDAEGSLARTEDGPQAERLAQARRRLQGQQTSFAEVLAAESLRLDVRSLLPWSRWITPSAERRRYDTQFFLTWLPDGQAVRCDGEELVNQTWLPFGRALMAHHRMSMFLSPPTLRTIEEIRAFGDRAALSEESERGSATTVLPKLLVESRGIRVLLPWDSGYADAKGEGAPAAPAPRQAAGPSFIAVRRPQRDDDAGRAAALLHFWYGAGGDDVVGDPAQTKLWFRGGPDFDGACEGFADDIARAERGEYSGWIEDPQRAAALILLLDQIPRNIFRGTARAFAFDAAALRAAQAGIEAGFDRQLPPVMRKFFYMPLMHAEDVVVQDRCVELFEALAEDVPADRREGYTGTIGFARRHRDIVVRFGRYPHRNDILGRPCTPEEIEFLKQPGSSF